MTDKPRRAAIYARFSSDLQDARSVTDQIELCREHARRQHWAVAQVYTDEAISGATMHGRLALLRMVDDAERRAFDVILVEHIDRLARNAADTIRLREEMEFRGIEIHTCASGLVTEMHAGLEGLMSAMYLKQLAVHVRRGQAGRVREGLSGGGLTFGYAPVPGRRGERTIVEAEAEIVRRVFAEYVAGRTPRDIAIDLNRDKVPPPRGEFWSASTIHGNRARAADEAKRHRKETRLGEVQREFQRVYNSYVKGMVSEEETGPLLAQLREEREALTTELAAMTPPTNVITLHPGAVKRYLAMVNDLANSLPHRTVSGDEGISIALRELVSCVTITPRDKGTPKITVTGRMAVLVGGDLFPHSCGDIGGSGGGI